MRVENQPGINRASASRPAGARRADGFAAMVGGTGARSVQTSAPVGLVGGIIVVDDDADAAGSPSRGLAAGRDLLDELEDLRRALLVGSVSGARLDTVARKLDMLATPGDPGLAAIIDDIRLRVAVELAKLSPAHIAACRSLAGPV